MKKMTIYLPEDLAARLEAEAEATSTTKAEIIRQGIGMLLEHSAHLRQRPAADPERQG